MNGETPGSMRDAGRKLRTRKTGCVGGGELLGLDIPRGHATVAASQLERNRRHDRCWRNTTHMQLLRNFVNWFPSEFVDNSALTAWIFDLRRYQETQRWASCNICVIHGREL